MFPKLDEKAIWEGSKQIEIRSTSILFHFSLFFLIHIHNSAEIFVSKVKLERFEIVNVVVFKKKNYSTINFNLSRYRDVIRKFIYPRTNKSNILKIPKNYITYKYYKNLKSLKYFKLSKSYLKCEKFLSLSSPFNIPIFKKSITSIN